MQNKFWKYIREIDLNENIINSKESNEEGNKERRQYCLPNLNANVEELDVESNQVSSLIIPLSFDLNDDSFIEIDIQVREILKQSNLNNCKFANFRSTHKKEKIV